MARVLAVVAAVAAVAGVAAAAGGAAPELDDATFYEVVGKDKPVLVKFYAPWCGHCKAMAADYEAAAAALSKVDVVIASVDADAHKSLASAFGVKGFPTLKWFPKGSTTAEEYAGGRSLDDLLAFVNGKLGTHVRVPKPASTVVDLDPSNFDAVVGDNSKTVLVEFFAPWCGHCKALAPTYEKLGGVFAGESSVVVAKVDADKHRSLGERFGVTGFPTLKVFHAIPGAIEDRVHDYQGGRDLADFVTALNDLAGTHRTPSGGLKDTAGRLPDFDDLAKEFTAAADKAAVYAEAKEMAAGLTSDAAAKADVYVKAMGKILEKGAEWAAKEVARLDGLLASDSISAAKKTDFAIRKNVLATFA